MANSQSFSFSINGVTKEVKNFKDLKEAIEQTQNELNNAEFGSDNFKQLSAQLDKVTAEFNSLSKATAATEKQAAKAGTTSKSMGGSFKDAFGVASLAAGSTGEAIGALEGGLGKATNGLGFMKKGFGSLKGAIASTGLGILLILLGSLVTYFTETQQGMDFINKKTKALQAVFSVFTQVIAAFGKAIFEALSNPKKLIQDIVDFVKNKVIPQFKGFGTILEGIKNFDTAQIKKGFGEVGAAIDNVKAGIVKAGESLGDLAKKAQEAAAAAELIETSNQKLLRSERELGVSKAETRAEVERLKLIAGDTTKDINVRIAAAKRGFEIESAINKELLKIQDQKIKNKQAEIKLSGQQNDTELVALAELRKARAEIAGESITLQAELTNTINSAEAEKKAKIEEAEIKRKEAATKRLENEKQAVVKRKELLEKELTDIDAASNQELQNKKAALDRELLLAEKGSDNYLLIQKQKAALDTEIALKAIDDKFSKAGAKEQIALLGQIDEITKAGNDLQTKLDDDFNKEQTTKALDNELIIAQIKLVGLKEGQMGYREALIEQINAEEKIALNKLVGIAGQEAAITKIKVDAEKQRKDITNNKPKVDFGASILKNMLGVDDEDVAGVKAAINDATSYALQATQTLLANVSQARIAAIQAQVDEAQSIIDQAKAAADALTSQLSDSQSRIDDLESRLQKVKGVEREKIIAQLTEERKRNHLLFNDKKKEDERSRAAEQQKLELEKKKAAEMEKQTAIQNTLNALGAIGVAINAVAAVAEAGKGGKFGFDNIAYILAATGAIAGAFIAVKSAAKFDKGGFTGSGYGEADESGHKPAGIVHANEYVIPAKMVTNPKYQGIISGLEAARTGGSYAVGGFVQPSITSSSVVDLSMLVNMQQQMVELRQDTNAALSKPTFVSHQQYQLFDENVNTVKNEFYK